MLTVISMSTMFAACVQSPTRPGEVTIYSAGYWSNDTDTLTVCFWRGLGRTDLPHSV